MGSYRSRIFYLKANKLRNNDVMMLICILNLNELSIANLFCHNRMVGYEENIYNLPITNSEKIMPKSEILFSLHGNTNGFKQYIIMWRCFCINVEQVLIS